MGCIHSPIPDWVSKFCDGRLRPLFGFRLIVNGHEKTTHSTRKIWYFSNRMSLITCSKSYPVHGSHTMIFLTVRNKIKRPKAWYQFSHDLSVYQEVIILINLRGDVFGDARTAQGLANSCFRQPMYILSAAKTEWGTSKRVPLEYATTIKFISVSCATPDRTSYPDIRSVYSI